LDDFNLAVELEPEIAIYHFCRGLVFKEMKDYAQAVANLDRAIEIEPNNAEYYCSRGRLHSHRNNTDEALADMNKAVELDSANSDYLHWRGRIRRDRQECVEAMADFEAAVKMTGDDIDYAWRGIMHSHLKRNKEALADIDQAIKLAPSNSFHYQFRGIIYFGLERYDSAIADFSEAIKLLPNWAGHYVWRAAVQYELEQWNNTATDLDKAVSLRPDEVSLFWRALLALQQRQIWQARTDLTAAIQAASRPMHSRIYFWDGIAKWLGEEKDEALKSWQESYRLSVVEKKVSRHTEPARIWLLGPTIGDLVGVFNSGVNNNNNNNGDAVLVNITAIDPSLCVKEAKALYEATFDGAYTIDNTKTENSHLDLLHRLFPKNSAIKDVARWFKKKRMATYPETEGSKKNNTNAGEEIKDQNKSRTKDHRR
jgi:tetratricopeptide (TPR) repeat protein